VDYAFETNALLAVLPARGPFAELETPENANHAFQLRMAAVPAGQVPCLVGSVDEIGGWGWHSAVPLVETAPNIWRKNLYLPVDWHIEYKYGLFDLALQCAVSLESGENRVLPSRFIGTPQWTKVSDECYRRDVGGLFRGAGVAMPVFSLRGAKSLGVGEFADLKPLADWAKGVGLKLIQILPVNDTTSSHDWKDSYPYSAISVSALHPLYLRIDDLKYAMPAAFKKALEAARDQLNPLAQVDYEAVMRVKIRLTREIFTKHRAAILAGAPFKEFLKTNGEWAIPYAVFCVKRDHYGSADFSLWEEWALFERERVHALIDPARPEWPEIAYHLWLQYDSRSRATCRSESTAIPWKHGPRRTCSRWTRRPARRRTPSR
jgi:4-alpha-glucanotransferase